MEITTIKITKETKSRLDHLRLHNRESYEEIIQRMLSILNTCKADPGAARGKLSELERLKNRIDKL